MAQNHAVGRDRACQALAVLERMNADNAPEQAATIELNLRSILGQCLRHLGDDEASAREYRAGLSAAELIGDEDSISRLLGNLGLLLVDQGKFDEALVLLRSVANNLRSSEDYRLAGHAVFNVAYALHRQGDQQTARKEADAALALLEMIADPMAEEVRRQVAGWSA
jgi:tetratricopeptide (TPR) repeat protein